MSEAQTIQFDDPQPESARALRDAFGCFTTGVTIVTTRSAAGKPVGFTANSFASVSLEPPLALMCVDLKAQSLPALETTGAFAVNVLHIDQQTLAQQFTRKDMDRFAGVDFEHWQTGIPILANCMANFECVTQTAVDAGDHQIYVGRVLKLRYDAQKAPLIYFSGRYRAVKAQHLE